MYNHYLDNERNWSAKPSAQQCMWLYVLPCTFCFVPAYAQFVQRFQSLSCFVHSVSPLFAMHIVLFLPMQSSLTHFWRYSRALCNLPLVFLADFTLSDSTAFIRFIAFAKYTLLFIWIERHDHSIHMSSILQVQQFYTASIPLLEA